MQRTIGAMAASGPTTGQKSGMLVIPVTVAVDAVWCFDGLPDGVDQTDVTRQGGVRPSS